MPSPIFKNNEKFYSSIIIYTPTIIGIVALTATTILKLNDLSVVAATLTCVFSVLSITILGQKNLRTALQYADDTQWSVKKHLHATPVGSPEKALEYISARLPALREVRNTSFNTDNVDIIDIKLYTKKSYRNFCDGISESCANDLVWIDIGDDHSVSRFRSIMKKSLSLSNGGPIRYSYKILNSNCPHMNFIILYYKDGSTDTSHTDGKYAEVLFNWDFRSNEGDPIVYMSTDRELVSMYSVHFNTMLKHSSKDADFLG